MPYPVAACRGKGGAPPIVYLIHDRFTTARAAGAVDGTAAEPGPGTRDVTDTANAVSITDRKYLFGSNGTNVWNDPDLSYTPGGQIMAASFQFLYNGASGTGPGMLISPTERPANPAVTGLGGYADSNVGGAAAGGLYAIPLNLPVTSPLVRFRCIPYILHVIRRPSGGAWLILAGGIYGNGTLLWVEDTDDIVADTYLGITSKAGNIEFDTVRAIAAAALVSPFTTDFGAALSRDTFTRPDSTSLGSTEVGGQAWAEWGGGASITNNALTCVNGGGALIDLGVLPRIIDVDVVVPAGEQMAASITFRSNAARTESLLFYSAWFGGALYIDGANVQGGPGVLIAGQTNRMRVVDFGDHIKCYVNNGLAIDYSSAAHYDLAHTHIGVGAHSDWPAGGVADNFRVWPVALVPPAVLGTVPPPAAGTGVALFSDDFTNVDGTLLSAHNAAWTVINSGSWDGVFSIQGNKVQMADPGLGCAVVDVGTADMEVEADITLPDTEPTGADEWMCGLVARWTDELHQINARLIYTSGREIECWQAGGVGDGLICMMKVGVGNLEKNTTYNLRLAVAGDTFSVYLNDVLMGQTRTGLLTGTKGGIAVTHDVVGAGNIPKWDNFSVKAAV